MTKASWQDNMTRRERRPEQLRNYAEGWEAIFGDSKPVPIMPDLAELHEEAVWADKVYATEEEAEAPFDLTATEVQERFTEPVKDAPHFLVEDMLNDLHERLVKVLARESK